MIIPNQDEKEHKRDIYNKQSAKEQIVCNEQIKDSKSETMQIEEKQLSDFDLALKKIMKFKK